MADLARYSIIEGRVIVCRDCRGTERGSVVHAFTSMAFSVEDLHSEVFIHEADYHEPAFEDTASEIGLAARRVAKALKERAEAAQVDLDNDDYFRGYNPATAYRDGMANGMGGSTGNMASLLGPDVALALSRALSEIAEMDGSYDELIQDHNRKTCDDFTCFVFGHLVDIARAVDQQLEQG